MTAVARPPDGEGLLERDGEVAEIDGVVARAVAGDGVLLLVEGPAGIGKTRLVAEARRRGAAAGMRVLAARSGELERDYPFGVVRQLFEGVVMGPGGEEALAGAAEAARPIFGSVEGGATGEGDSGFAALHGLYWLVVNLTAAAPVVVAVDDLHWSDRPSLRFLAYLARRLEGLPLLVVGSVRPGEAGADAALIGELGQDPAAHVLRPSPLSSRATAGLIGARLGAEPDEEFARACHGATGGNPLLLHELLRAMHSEGVTPDAGGVQDVVSLGPRAVSRPVLVRLARLPPEAVGIARALAVLGEGAPLEVVARLAGIDEDAAAAASGRLARAEIIRAEPPLGFIHPLVREAVYLELAPGERERAHARAARLLADAGATDERVAAQLLAIPPAGQDWVVGTLARAAGVAMGRGASDGAVRYLRRALAEPPPPPLRAEILYRLGVAEGLLNGPVAADHLLAAREEARDPALRARASALVLRILPFTGRLGEALAVADAALEETTPGEADLRRQIQANRLALAFFAPRGPVGIDDPAFAAIRDAPFVPGPGARMLDGMAAYHWALTGGRAEACTPLALRAVAGGELIQADSLSVPHAVAIITLAMADRDEAVSAASDALAAAHRDGSVFAASGSRLFLGLTLWWRGELEEAERLFRAAVRDVADWGSIAVREIPHAFLADVLLERGDPEEARAVLAAGVAPPELRASASGLWGQATRMRIAIAGADGEAALAVADEVARDLPFFTNPAALPVRSLRAQALHLLGRDREAVAPAAEEVAAARRWGAPRALGQALRVLGGLARDRGEDHLREAVAVLEGSPARLEHAKALAALGTALRHARRPTDAREPLGRALDLATACGATPLVEHVRTELVATGARPRPGAQAGVRALTGSERRVAGMAAGGLSNRDIAQALYVTPKTVEVHLSNTYRKLRIRSRRELPEALAAP